MTIIITAHPLHANQTSCKLSNSITTRYLTFGSFSNYEKKGKNRLKWIAEKGNLINRSKGKTLVYNFKNRD